MKISEALNGTPRVVSYQFEWGVIAFGIGIAIYFSLPFEPHYIYALAAILILILAVYFARRFGPPLKIITAVLIILYIGFGLFRSAWHTQSLATPFLKEGSYTVTGWIEAIEKAQRGTRWRVRVTDIEGYNIEAKPYRIRVNVRKYEGHGGDMVRFSARLSPPPPPVMSQAYDPARKAFFDRISATGFIYGPPDILQSGVQDLKTRAERWLARSRYGLAERILEKSPPETAGLQTALLTGVRTFIPDSQVKSLRASGLAHVLAISGLHMGLLAGGAYSLASLLFACITPLSRRYDIRKAAAIIGAITATFYLVLSGASVATQRAYIMAIIVFLAVILDRRAFSLRSVSVAAIVTLVLHPESLMSAGFQMSFAAVTALVIVYQNWDASRDSYAASSFGKLKSGLKSLSVTSFVAGMATSGFAVLHFGRMAKYGLLGNLLAMPVFSLIVMPAALLTFIALPFGAETLPLQIMGWGLSYVLFIADGVANLSGALVHIKSPPPWVLSVYALAFIGLCIGHFKTRIGSVILMGLSMLIWKAAPIPDIRVSEQGRIAILSDIKNETPKLWVSSKRADRYGRDKFVGRAGLSEVVTDNYHDTFASCDSLVCRLHLKGRDVSIVQHPSEVGEACQNSDIVILTKREAGPVARRNCGSVLIDGRTLSKSGAQDIYFKDAKVSVQAAVTQARKNRPWGYYQRQRN